MPDFAHKQYNIQVVEYKINLLIEGVKNSLLIKREKCVDQGDKRRRFDVAGDYDFDCDMLVEKLIINLQENDSTSEKKYVDGND